MKNAQKKELKNVDKSLLIYQNVVFLQSRCMERVTTIFI